MQIIYADNIQTVNEVMYGPRSDALLNDLRAGLNNYDQSILTDLGRTYAAEVQQNFETVSGWKVVNASRKALAGISGFDAPDVILPLFSDDAFGTASPIMQRMLMADVEIRHMYQKKRIDGWSDTYVDYHPKKIGDDHYDHRLAMDGVVVRTDSEEIGTVYSVTEYRHELKPREVQLSTSNRLDIRRSALFMRSRMSKGLKDLTSLYDEEVS